MLNSPDAVNPVVAEFEPYEPGLSIEEIQEKYGLDRVIKMASNENILGTSRLVQKAIQDNAHQAFRYPQAGNPKLVAAIAARHGVDPGRVFVANGSDEVIDLLFRVRTVPGKHNAAVFCPCFGIYTTQARLAGVELRQTNLRDDFSFDFEAMARSIDEHTSLAFITSPDNPSGKLAPVEDIAAFARKLPPQCLLVVDEAYIEFAGEEHSLLSRLGEFPNVALLRTFSKLYGLAGLRIGYGIYPGNLADYMWRVRLPFSLNTLAEKAALAALEDTAYQEETLALTRHGRQALSAGLERLGFRVIPSHANFIMASPPQGHGAAGIIQALLRRGVIVRSLRGYRLPDWLRITVGTKEENEIFLSELHDILERTEKN